MLDTAPFAADLEAVAVGDEAALLRLWEKAGPTLYGLSLRLMRRHAAADDVLQESFVRIWRKAHQYDRALGDALGWMAAVTRNVALDHLRHERGRAEQELDEGRDHDALHQLGELDFARADLQRCIDRLSEQQKRAIVLAYFRGMTHIEIAEVLNAPLGTVKSWVRRALIELKECLER